MRLPGRTCMLVLLLGVISGCAVWRLPDSQLSEAMSETDGAPPPERLVQFSSFPAVIDVEDLKVGEYCEMQIPSPPAELGPQQPTDSTKLAGRVASISESTVVLVDVISVDDRIVRMNVAPTMNKIPYVSRLFKNTGVLVSPVKIPGELAIPRSSIHLLVRIDANTWPQYQQSGFQRIGIDFDFDIEDHGSK